MNALCDWCVDLATGWAGTWMTNSVRPSCGKPDHGVGWIPFAKPLRAQDTTEDQR